MNIEEAKKKLLEPQKIPLVEIIRKFKREGIENFVITRPEIVEALLTAYEKEKEKIENQMNLIKVDFMLAKISEKSLRRNKTMSEGIKKYIMISGTILLVLSCIGVCWLLKFIPQFVLIFAYLIGLCNGMLILGISNYDE